MIRRAPGNGSSRLAMIAATVHLAACATASPDRANLDATLWVQTAAEYEAVTRSIYRSAAHDLSALLADSSVTAAVEQDQDYSRLPAAVILDVDETVLDNSPFQARLLLDGDSYDGDRWMEWVNEASAGPVPGSLEFTRRADRLGITVFYVTNRRAVAEEPTRRNLAGLGYPLRSDLDVVLSRGERPEWSGAKSSRRRAVAREFRVLMVIGDDLNDFVDVAGLSARQRDSLIIRYSDRWGERWRMLPNPTYGSWERALIGPGSDLSPAERSARKMEHLEPGGGRNE